MLPGIGGLALALINELTMNIRTYGMRICQLVLLIILVGKTEVSIAQLDSVVLKNGNVITGEIKVFDNGVLTIKTPYSKADFIVKWAGIKGLYSKRAFLIEIENGQRANGTLQFLSEQQKVIITEKSGYNLETDLNKVVYLKPLQYNFWSHVKGSADVGPEKLRKIFGLPLHKEE